MEFSRDEIRDIGLAIVGLIVILVIEPLPAIGVNLDLLPGYFVGIVIGFLLHELAHKGVATRFGAAAFFKLWSQGIGMGLLLALISPLKLLAPGAVMIYTHKFGRWHYRTDRVFITPYGSALSTGEMGIIAAAGPIVNILLAYIFQAIPGVIFQQISFINAFLAVFNLLPVPPLDGSKVFLWNGLIWLFIMILAVIPLLPVIF